MLRQNMFLYEYGPENVARQYDKCLIFGVECVGGWWDGSTNNCDLFLIEVKLKHLRCTHWNLCFDR
jgi:hypothetical protein